jgi:Leucine-rich repeat (LRR) protein
LIGGEKVKNRILLTLLAVMLALSVGLVACGGAGEQEEEEEEPCAICDPVNELREKLQLTDEQVAIIETGTGTLQLTTAQVDIVSDAVEELLNELEPLFDESGWQEVEDVFQRLLTEGEADLEALAEIAEELLELDSMGEVEIVTRLEKVSAEPSSSGRTQPLTTEPRQCTTIYEPGQVTSEGEEAITLSYEWAYNPDYPDEPNCVTEANPDTGALSAQSRSWIGCDRAYALLGVAFDVPADNTDVNITTAMTHIASKTAIGGAASGVAIPVLCNYRWNEAYEWIDYPLGWYTGVQVICTVLAALLPVGGPIDAGAVAACFTAEGTNYIIEELSYSQFKQALSDMDGAEEEEITYDAGSLDEGHYQFYIGLNARTCSFVVGLARAAGYAQVTEIEVTMGIPSFTLGITSTNGGQVTEPGEGPFTACEGEVVDLVAVPDTGHQFVGWTGDVDMVSNVNAASTTITMNDNHSITANFEEQAVTFPDPNLAAAIREAIGKPTGDIYPSDLHGLTSLDAPERGIMDLTGLEHCTGLTELDLFVNQISDISPLSGLTSLVVVVLRSNQISDVSPLANLTNLDRLFVSFNQISDISPLANLTGLSAVWARDNQIEDVSPLANLTSLRSLDLNSNQIGNISPLADLTNLHALQISDNQISDISPVDNLTNLRMLGLQGNAISDISPLANLTSLKRLELSHNPIHDGDISLLADFTGLEDLFLASNQISDISPLANLTNLEVLFLHNNQISDISALANLTNLYSLFIYDNQISDISPLVQNEGLVGTGDIVSLAGNPLSSDSINIYIPQLEARGVTVHH